MTRSDKALKAFYGAREDGNARPQEIFTPLWLVRPLLDVWGEIVLDPCGHVDSPVTKIANSACFAAPCELDSKGTPTAWDGHGMGGLDSVWVDRTYCNPPFSELKAWLDHASRQSGRNAVLFPSRLQRPWVRAFMRGRVNIFLNSVKFEGYAQAFPQSLCMSVVGIGSDDVAELYELSGLGERI